MSGDTRTTGAGPADPPAEARRAPAGGSDRFESLDVLRGVAVLGILMVNVQAFTMASNAYIYPPAHMDVTGANATAWLITHVFFELKFITIFSALFGAGMLLMVGDAPGASRALHYSRMRWLLVVGLIHMFALWYGDILTTYAISGFIIVLFRTMSAARLIVWGLIFTALSGLLFLALMGSFALIPEEAGMSPVDLGMAYTDEALSDLVAQYQNGWLSSRLPNAVNALGNLASFLLFGGRVVGVMLLGMALFKLGFMTARWSAPAYLLGLVIGLCAGLPIAAWGGLHAVETGWALDQLWVHVAANYVGSLLVAFGYASAIMLICKAPWLKLIRLPFAAAGRMAFTNYLAQSIVMVFLTVGGIGLGLYGELERTQQVQLVLVIWIAQLVISPVWLALFRFGPAEWLWRSLSYGKVQPFLKGRR